MSFKTAKNVLSKDEMKKIMAGSEGDPTCITEGEICDPYMTVPWCCFDEHTICKLSLNEWGVYRCQKPIL